MTNNTSRTSYSSQLRHDKNTSGEDMFFIVDKELNTLMVK